jgi:biotin transport system substrate-specific component
MPSRKLPLRGMVFAALFGAVTALGAYLIIPLQPVPITMQTLFVSLSGAPLGGYLGALSQVIYLLLGTIGLPVFAGGTAGPGVLLGPSGGYLFGSVACALVIGLLINLKQKPGFVWIFLSVLAGNIVLYIFGLAQLSMVAKLGLVKTFLAGALPFLPGDLLKIIAVSLIALKLRGRINLPGGRQGR